MSESERSEPPITEIKPPAETMRGEMLGHLKKRTASV
ncbi:MAG: hypothetical protein KatS3mg087_0381 [Patescibacteria group bacterium]|nr:MAG: hypothetical protein KatS3mg087_0381 [Patescibacteria group bacterium]